MLAGRCSIFVVGYISSDNILIGKNMFGLGPLELVVIGVIAVMLFGKQLPEVGLRVG